MFKKVLFMAAMMAAASAANACDGAGRADGVAKCSPDLVPVCRAGAWYNPDAGRCIARPAGIGYDDGYSSHIRRNPDQAPDQMILTRAVRAGKKFGLDLSN